MKLDTPFRLTAAILLSLCVACPATAQQAPPWPDRWLSEGLDFGRLKVEYRLTDECDIDLDFEITESPNLDVTRDEVFESLTGFLAAGTRDDPPRDVLYGVFDQVLDPERDPNQPMSQTELAAVLAELERLGPWPKVRMAPVGRYTYRCTLDTTGTLIRLERSVAGEDEFSDVVEQLSDQGPFYLTWSIEE